MGLFRKVILLSVTFLAVVVGGSADCIGWVATERRSDEGTAGNDVATKELCAQGSDEGTVEIDEGTEELRAATKRPNGWRRGGFPWWVRAWRGLPRG